MLISEAKWRVRAFQSFPWSPNAQKKRKSSLSKTTPTEKRAHTFRAFAEATLTMRRSREARQRRASMLVIYIIVNYYIHVDSPLQLQIDCVASYIYFLPATTTTSLRATIPIRLLCLQIDNQEQTAYYYTALSSYMPICTALTLTYGFWWRC